MNKKQYNAMIEEAIEHFTGRNINYIGMLSCLKVHEDRYITKAEIEQAKERINTLKHLDSLGLLK